MGIAAVWLVAAWVAVGQQDISGSVRVAVVDVPAASEQYLRTADLEAHFENLRRKFSEERDALRSKQDRMARSLQEELKPGTDEFRERTKQLVLLEAEFQWFIESEGQKVERGLATSLRTIFDDIQAVVREIAEARGIDVVLAYQKMPDEAPESATLVRQHILLQKVLYWNPRVDLTKDVVTRLNAKYRARGVRSPIGSARAAESEEDVLETSAHHQP